MKGASLLICTALLFGGASLASAADVSAVHLADAAAMRDAGDRLARCAGTYRGAAELMRRSGREAAASYAESVGFGALFAAYLLLTSPAAIEADVLGDVDPNVHIEALAWGSERNFVMLDAQADGPTAQVLRTCTETKLLQSSLLRGALPVLVRSAL